MRGKNVLFPLIVRGDSRAVQRIKCVRCGEAGEAPFDRPGSDEQVTACFRRRGWEVDARRERHHCPKCIAAVAAERRETEARKRMTNKTRPAETALSPVSALAKKIMSDLLFEAYDLTARDYRSGWSDARIARESGLSETFVAQRRAADYGPIPPPAPPILDVAHSRLSAASATLRDVSESAAALRAKADQAHAQVAALMGEVTREIAARQAERK